MFNYQIVAGVYYGFVKSLLMIRFNGYENKKSFGKFRSFFREVPRFISRLRMSRGGRPCLYRALCWVCRSS